MVRRENLRQVEPPLEISLPTGCLHFGHSTKFMTSVLSIPLAVGMHAPGREIEGPMALVILGGLITSMALNLMVLPTLALRYGRFVPRRDEFEQEVATSPSSAG